MENNKRIMLENLYDMVKFDYNRLELPEVDKKLNESYLTKLLYELERDRFIGFNKSRAFIPGGRRTKYGNSIMYVHSEDIWLESKGKEYVEKLRVPIKKKVASPFINFLKDVGKQIRSTMVEKTAAYIFTILLTVFLVVIYLFFSSKGSLNRVAFSFVLKEEYHDLYRWTYP